MLHILVKLNIKFDRPKDWARDLCDSGTWRAASARSLKGPFGKSIENLERGLSMALKLVLDVRSDRFHSPRLISAMRAESER
jgi:hypothetical protein